MLMMRIPGSLIVYVIAFEPCPTVHMFRSSPLLRMPLLPPDPVPLPVLQFSPKSLRRLPEHCFATIRHGATTFPARSSRARRFHSEMGSFA